jgi:hypothetical protein
MDIKTKMTELLTPGSSNQKSAIMVLKESIREMQEKQRSKNYQRGGSVKDLAK